ncbi:MAG TPA: plasmid stabilization protein [Bacteroidales bacterium]|nr:plasmid stabilization protein [Bacteroidales bacterium]
MKVLFERSFLSDVHAVTDRKALKKLSELIGLLKSARSLSDIPNLKKLKGHTSAFRIKLGDFRIGLFLVEGTLILVKFQNRKDIYRGFPH